MTAKHLKTDNLPVIIFEKFKISDFLQNQNIIFDGSNLLTVKKAIAGWRVARPSHDLQKFYRNPDFKIYKKFELSNQQQLKYFFERVRNRCLSVTHLAIDVNLLQRVPMKTRDFQNFKFRVS